MPIPVSPTQKPAAPSRLASAIHTRPFSAVNFTALLNRL